MVQCMDREGDDVTALREQHMVGHMKHIEDIVDHIAMAGPLKDEAGEQIVGSFLAYRTDDLNQAKAWLDGDPYARERYLGDRGVVAPGARSRDLGWRRDLVGRIALRRNSNVITFLTTQWGSIA